MTLVFIEVGVLNVCSLEYSQLGCNFRNQDKITNKAYNQEINTKLSEPHKGTQGISPIAKQASLNASTDKGLQQKNNAERNDGQCSKHQNPRKSKERCSLQDP